MTETKDASNLLQKVPVGIPGFDNISDGGLPLNRSTIISGTSGAGKTIFGLQFVIAGVREYEENGVIVTFEETPADLICNVKSLGWDLGALVESGRVAFVDASRAPGEQILETGNYNLSALMVRIEHAVRKVGARRVTLDSVGSIFPQFTDSNLVRREIHGIVGALRLLGVTTVITVERTEEYGAVGRFGIEEFVADNVLIVRNVLVQEQRRRTIEILKYRGTSHQKGEFPFTIDAVDGINIMPLSSIELCQKSSNVRISSGSKELDTMCGGGLYRDSIILVSGATGTGKTLMVTEFVRAAIKAEEPALLFAFEESPDQLRRNTASWGVDYVDAEKRGFLKIVCSYPETAGLEDHLLNMKRIIDEFKPKRIAVDSMSALERVAPVKGFREFVIGITSHIKHQEVAGMFSNTTSMLMGSESLTETHISTITDSIIMLRYVELQGQMRRALMVLKMRGSSHDKQIREYVIDGKGLNIKEAFRGVSGILAGRPVYGMGDEKERMGEMFGGEEPVS